MRIGRTALVWTILASTAAGCASSRSAAPARDATPAASAASAPDKDYLVYVVSESVDRIALIRFGPDGARIDHELQTGLMPADVDGPHGVAISPDGRYYYVSIAHGTPWGTVWKYTTNADSVVGRVELGMFPATMQTTPDGEFLYVVNFNLHGDMVPSSVSIVATDGMMEVARPTTCTMPHGSRINPQGTKQYSGCMMDDIAVEIDTRTLAVSRHFMLEKGKEHGMDGAPRAMHMADTGQSTGRDSGGHGMMTPTTGSVSCSPTWVQPSHDGARIYVACNGKNANDIVEIDVVSWTMTRRIPAGDGVYNLAVTADGRRLLGTNKRGQSVSVFDLPSGRELARIATRRRIVHGVVVSPDDRYAFVSVEGVGSEPGTVEVIDLRALKTVATVDVGQQAAGIDFWRIEGGGGR